MTLPTSAVLYVYAWGNTPEREALKGRECRIMARGGKGTVLVEFDDNGQRETVSFRALRRADKSDNARDRNPRG